jgi:hypothetical protein
MFFVLKIFSVASEVGGILAETATLANFKP